MWSETDKDAPDKVETSASQWVSSLVLRWSVSSPLLQGVELVVWRVGLEVEFSAVQNGYRTIWILPSSLPGNWMAKNWASWGEVPVYFQIWRNQDCNEQESVLSREAAWPGIFFELTWILIKQRDFSPWQPFPPTPGTEKSQFLPFFLLPQIENSFCILFFLTYPSSREKWVPPISSYLSTNIFHWTTDCDRENT